MIPPHTVFLLQFAKYRPNCATTSPVAAKAAPAKNASKAVVSPLSRLLKPFAAPSA